MKVASDLGGPYIKYTKAVTNLSEILGVEPSQVSTALFDLTSQIRSSEPLFLAVFADNGLVKQETLAKIRAIFQKRENGLEKACLRGMAKHPLCGGRSWACLFERHKSIDPKMLTGHMLMGPDNLTSTTCRM